MLGDTIGITYNLVAKTLKKVNQDNYGAVYYLEETDRRFTAKVSHTVPSRGKTGESHHIRLDVEDYDATSGDYVRTASSWFVMKTLDAPQDSPSTINGADALVGFLTNANVTALAGRES